MARGKRKVAPAALTHESSQEQVLAWLSHSLEPIIYQEVRQIRKLNMGAFWLLLAAGRRAIPPCRTVLRPIWFRMHYLSGQEWVRRAGRESERA